MNVNEGEMGHLDAVLAFFFGCADPDAFARGIDNLHSEYEEDPAGGELAKSRLSSARPLPLSRRVLNAALERSAHLMAVPGHCVMIEGVIPCWCDSIGRAMLPV